MPARAVRGAITVSENTADEIINETRLLLDEVAKRNQIVEDDIVSVIFTVTKDLNAAFPAVAARRIGWTNTPLMCMNEIDVPGSLEKCIRVLIHINTDKGKDQIKHVYLKGASILRPDLNK